MGYLFAHIKAITMDFFLKRSRLLSSVFFVVLLVGCTRPSITINSFSSLDFAGDASSQSVSFVSTMGWVAAPSETWISVSPKSGDGGNATINVSVQANDPQNGVREGYLTITSEGLAEKLLIRQQQKDAIEVISGFTVEPSGGSLSISVEHNVDITVTIGNQAKDWVRFVGTKAMSSNKYDFFIERNNSATSRDATISFKGGSVSKEVIINQKGEFINVSHNSLAFNPDKSSQQIRINSSCSWIASSTESWLLVSSNSGNEGQTEISIAVLENDEYEARMGSVSIKNPGLDIVKTIDVTQEAYSWYIDENGVNRGKGISIDGKIWAPVNCGYDEISAPRGLYYQWGRKYGQYLDYSVADIWNGKNGDEDPQTVYRYSKDDENSGSVFKYDWIINGDNSFWNLGTPTSPKKNEAYDPCPKGWRVPTSDELRSLAQHSFYQSGAYGTWFSGSNEYSEDLKEKVFFPAAGHRKGYGDCSLETTGAYGFYWSSTTSSSSDSASYLFFKSTTYGYSYSVPYRRHGQSIRCIHE